MMADVVSEQQVEVEAQQTTSVLASIDSTGSRIHFHWGVGNEIFCCGVHEDSREPVPGSQVSTSTCIRWGHLGPAQRRVAYDTSVQFIDYMSSKNKNSKRGKISQYLGSSQASQQALEFAESVSEILGSLMVSLDDADEMYQLMEEKSLWEIVCAFVFCSYGDEMGEGSIPDIAGWYHGNATALCDSPSDAPLSEKTLHMIQNIDVPELESVYWSTFLRLVSLGWISDALDVLSLHSAWLRGGTQEPEDSLDPNSADIAVLENISSILRRFPSIVDKGVRSDNMTRQFNNNSDMMTFRRSWIQQCKQLKSNTSLWNACELKSPETKTACFQCLDILLGDEKAIQSNVQSWLELFVGYLAHIYPYINNLPELQQILSDVIAKYPPMNEFQDIVASVIKHCCQMDHQGVMKECSFIVSDWFLAHLPAILEVHPAGPGPLVQHLKHAGGDQLEFYRLNYAASLASSPLTWEVSARYMGFCENHGKIALERLLSKMSLCANGTIARRAIGLAKDYGLHGVCNVVRRHQGVKCWQNGLYGLAAEWFSSAGELSSMDICFRGLENYGEENIDDLEQCIRPSNPVHLNESRSNYANIMTKICAKKKSKESFELAVSTLRLVDKKLGVHCMHNLLHSIADLKPGFLGREDLILLMEYMNHIKSSDPLFLTSLRRLIELLVLEDIRQ